MNYSTISTGYEEFWQLPNVPGSTHLYTNFVLIAISALVFTILKVFESILEPMNYELNMTTKTFCKPLAEIDNSLRLLRGTVGELDSSTNKSIHSRQKATDCATELDRNISNQHSTNSQCNNNNNSDESGGFSEGAQQAGSANHTYPNGWIPLMESFKVKAGTVRKGIIFGRDVIVTRSSEGEVRVLDAYCPHMGVHIGIGGRVRRIDNQSCVECPFHGWTFRASDGNCVKIPYQKSEKASIPKQAKLGTWECTEVDNFIYVWYHVDNQPPNWVVEPCEELKAIDWQLAGRSCHKTNLEIRDMLENGADMNHFESIHNDLFVFGGEILNVQLFSHLQEYTRHHWVPNWKPVLDEKGKMTHMAEMTLQSWISFFNWRIFDITIRAKQEGPARVRLYYNSKWYGQGLLIMNGIPKGGRRTTYLQHIYTKRSLFQCFMAKWVLWGEIKMLERDFFIWNHKKNIRNPIFVAEDRHVKQFRKWYSQFYKRKREIKIEDSDCVNLVPNNVDF